MPTLVIADRHEIEGAGLEAILQAGGYKVIARCLHEDDLLRAAEAYRPRAGYYYDDEAYDGPYYAPTGYAGDPRNLCAQNFRSFEWNTGLYTTYGGDKRVCPYLR